MSFAKMLLLRRTLILKSALDMGYSFNKQDSGRIQVCALELEGRTPILLQGLGSGPPQPFCKEVNSVPRCSLPRKLWLHWKESIMKSEVSYSQSCPELQNVKSIS
jgi:hypothetical protein